MQMRGSTLKRIPSKLSQRAQGMSAPRKDLKQSARSTIQPIALLVLGDGPVALSSALGARALGFDVVLARKHVDFKHEDPRAWALRPASLGFLRQLDLPLRHQVTVKAMEVWHADSAGTPLPGYLKLTGATHSIATIVPNKELREEFEQSLHTSEISLIQIDGQYSLPNPVSLREEVGADLVLLCDPKWRNALPKSQQPMLSAWTYDHIAVTAPVALQQPHHNVARQVFLPSGPVALLPLPDSHLASMIWSISKSKWQALKKKPDPDLVADVQAYMGLGLVFDAGDLTAFSLTAQHATRYVGNKFVLLGDAAHQIHPLAGQGLNLGLADVGALLDVLVSARAIGADLGDPEVLKNFERKRRTSNEVMRAVTDQLTWIFGQEWGPIRLVRCLGLSLFDRPLLKRRLLDWISDPTPLSSSLCQIVDPEA